MTVERSIKQAQDTLANFHKQEEEAGGIEQIIGKLVRITQGEAGVVLTPMEAAACSQAIGVCVYLTNGILIHKHGPKPAPAAVSEVPGTKVGQLADGFVVMN